MHPAALTADNKKSDGSGCQLQGLVDHRLGIHHGKIHRLNHACTPPLFFGQLVESRRRLRGIQHHIRFPAFFRCKYRRTGIRLDVPPMPGSHFVDRVRGNRGGEAGAADDEQLHGMAGLHEPVVTDILPVQGFEEGMDVIEKQDRIIAVKVAQNPRAGISISTM